MEVSKGRSVDRRLARCAPRALLGALALGAVAFPAVAQDTAPRLPSGSVAVVLPVQSSEPLPGGAWPGAATSQEEALRAMDAELAFALADRRAAGDWALPPDLRRRVARNPMIKVDPDRVAFQGLVARPDRREQIYEPLHGELRALAALFGTRFVVLPLRLRVAPGRDAPRADGADGAAPADAACAGGQAPVRPELLLALIDIRRSAVLWHGTVWGRAACAEDGGLLAGLAASVARQLTES
ncbi:MAG: hypothetical protein ACOC9N_00210 [Gemmatimonadota bacterium]